MNSSNARASGEALGVTGCGLSGWAVKRGSTEQIRTTEKSIRFTGTLVFGFMNQKDNKKSPGFCRDASSWTGYEHLAKTGRV
jgi:hypothetical protein